MSNRPSPHQDSPKVPEAVEKVARAFHDEYEAWAQAKGWETQETTRTGFDDLPAENRETMLATVQSLIDRRIVIPVSALLSEQAVEAGAKGFAEGFSLPDHPCRTDPCEECLDDAYRVLRAAIEQVGGTK